MKTPHMTQYMCDRCGKTGYLPDSDTTSSDARTWYEIQRMTGDATQAVSELCEKCHTDYMALLKRQTAEFDQWLKNQPATSNGTGDAGREGES